MAEVQVKRVSVRHDAIMDYMLANPTVPLGAVAVEFCVSQAWLSVIIHSDTFQQQLSEKKSELFGAAVVPVRQKLNGVASLALDKLADVLENASPVSDKTFIANTADAILKSCGYAPKSGPGVAVGEVVNNTQNIIVVNKESLADARKLMLTVSPPKGGVTIEQKPKRIPS